MTNDDDLRAAVERLARDLNAPHVPGWTTYSQGYADASRDAGAALDHLLAEHSAPEPPSGGEVTAEELAEVVRLARMVAYEDGMGGWLWKSAGSDEIAAAIRARYDVRRRA